MHAEYIFEKEDYCDKPFNCMYNNPELLPDGCNTVQEYK